MRSWLLPHASVSTCTSMHSSEHGEQDKAPEAVVNFPGSHCVHTEILLSLYLPGRHCWQSAPFVVLSYPDTHWQSVRAVEPTGDPMLAGQFWQVPALPIPQPETYWFTPHVVHGSHVPTFPVRVSQPKRYFPGSHAVQLLSRQVVSASPVHAVATDFPAAHVAHFVHDVR